MDLDMKPPLETGPMTSAPVNPVMVSPPDPQAAVDLNLSPLETGGGPFIIKRRSPIACRRCRRMRSKCLHDKGKAPCQACKDAGLAAADCVFPVRGQPDHDRDYRHPRVRAEKSNKRDPAKVRREILDAPVQLPLPTLTPRLPKAFDEWDYLPPLHEIIEAVNKFTRHYFQLGFIPKQQFPERLRNDPRSVSVFYLLGILSVSARLTPSLAQRYGGGVHAAETFMERASTVALTELYKEPDLEKCQAFYLLSIAQQGSGMKDRSAVNMAIALRMATLMQLHREETYVLVNPTKDLIIRAESARRTLWMLHSQDNLHSGPRSPVSLPASDITTLLPCNEEDFANAREPKSRAALEDTPPALKEPKLVADSGRSLFATLIQAHYYWGAISRRAIKYDRSVRPWEPTSEFAKTAKRLAEWENGLENDHRWSAVLLKGYKQEGQDLAYLGVTMITRLCNIVIRKAYLHEMMSTATSDPKLVPFWTQMSRDLFMNVKDLFEQIDTQYADKSPEEGMGAQMAAFCVYTCGFLSCYLCKYPSICPDPAITREGPNMVRRILSILDECKNTWPLASRWYDHLEKFYNDQKGAVAESEGNEGSMADSRDPIHHVLHPALNTTAKPALPRLPPRSPEESGTTASHSPVTPIPQLIPQQQQQQQSTTPTMYIDPNLRLPAPQQLHQQTPGPQVAMGPPGTPQQSGVGVGIGLGVGMTSPQQPHRQLQAVAGPARQQSTDGLGLLIEAFDTTHQTASAGSVMPPSPVTPGGVSSSGGGYDQHTAAAAAVAAAAVMADQGYYQNHHAQQATAVGLAMNDGYENELGYYMAHPAGVPTIQNWSVAGGGMYGAY